MDNETEIQVPTLPTNPFSRLPTEVTGQILDYVWGSFACLAAHFRYSNRVPYLIHISSVCRLFRQLSNRHPFWCEDCHWHRLFHVKTMTIPNIIEAYDLFSKEYDRLRDGFMFMNLNCLLCRLVFMPNQFVIPEDADRNEIIRMSRRFLRRLIVHNGARIDKLKEATPGITWEEFCESTEEENWVPPDGVYVESPIVTLIYRDRVAEIDKLMEEQPDIEPFGVFVYVVDLVICENTDQPGTSECCLSRFPNLTRFKVSSHRQHMIKSMLDLDQIFPHLQYYCALEPFRLCHRPNLKRRVKVTHLSDLQILYRLSTRPENPVALHTIKLKNQVVPHESNQMWTDVIMAQARSLQSFGFYVSIVKDFPFVEIVKTVLRNCPNLEGLALYCRNNQRSLPLKVLNMDDAPFKIDFLAAFGVSLRHYAPKLKMIKIKFVGGSEEDIRFTWSRTAASIERLRVQIVELGHKAEALRHIVRDDGFARFDVDFTTSLNNYHQKLAASIEDGM